MTDQVDPIHRVFQNFSKKFIKYHGNLMYKMKSMVVKFETLYKNNTDNTLRSTRRKVLRTMTQAPSTAKVSSMFWYILHSDIHTPHITSNNSNKLIKWKKLEIQNTFIHYQDESDPTRSYKYIKMTFKWQHQRVRTDLTAAARVRETEVSVDN